MTDANTMVERLETDVRYSDTALVEFHVPLKALRHEAAALIRSQQEENAALRKVLSEEGLTVNYQVDAVTKRLEAAEAEIKRLTPLAVAYDYLESPVRADAAEAENAVLRDQLQAMRKLRNLHWRRAIDAERKVAVLQGALEPFANYMKDGLDHDYRGNPLPDEQTVAWVYLTHGDFRRARAAGRRER